MCSVLDSPGQVDVRYLCSFILSDVGFRDDLMILIKSYLFDRRQFVEYGSYKSPIYSISSGVPQFGHTVIYNFY